ncbi:CRP-like cAMP-binding protein [Pedobacter sp. UYP30]|uniref:Crp/Fnr family transcriptional regulator n=1 Tax=Pedobacter sp. UYP30 TaxID=1756400 RepID=UPI003397779B
MRHFLLQHIDLTEDEFTDFFSATTQRLFKKGTLVFEQSKIFDKLYFIEEGLIRSFRIKNGEDITYHFYLKQEFCVDFYSYLNDSPSEFLFEALTDTTVYEISKAAMTIKMQKIAQIEKLGRLMAEKAYNSVAERLREIQVTSLEERYLKLLNRNPKLFQDIQQRHIATYLGVKPESLSRIKAQLHKKR